VQVELAFVGFPVDDVFVVGYGLDRDQRYRSLPFVGALVD
jgi:hypoxanthine-guanine phosphoribosyltransferase